MQLDLFLYFQNGIKKVFQFPLLQPFGMNDVMGCYLDLDKREIKWSKNGEYLSKK